MNTKRLNAQTGTSNHRHLLPDLSGKTIPALLAEIDEAIFKKAAKGDAAAAKLCYQRFEGWSAEACFDMEIGMDFGQTD